MTPADITTTRDPTELELPPAPVMKATQQQLKDNRVPLNMRDYCAHLWIKWDHCRYNNYKLPWRCKFEEYSHKKCEHKEFQRRVKVFERRRMQDLKDEVERRKQ